jgi:hypothetical protein
MRKKGDLETPTEIKITPEMIQAGVEAFVGFDPRFETEEDVVPRVFLAMLTLWPGLPAWAGSPSLS